MRGHGGDIELQRTGDTGTIFCLTMPVEPAERGASPLAAHG
jgi:signal transduction histidine kinase